MYLICKKVKILVVGKQSFLKWPENVAGAFGAQHEVELFLYNKKTLFYGLVKMWGSQRRNQIMAARLKRRIEKMKPDLIFYVSCCMIPQEFYDVLGEFPHVKKVAWAGDAYGREILPRVQNLDALFLTDTGFFSLVEDLPCPAHYLPLCVNERDFAPTHQPKTLPPFFVGVANQNRVGYFKACMTPCLIYGKGWPVDVLTQHDVRNVIIDHTRVIELINRSVAPLNVGVSSNNRNGLNLRVFEVSACGGLVIVYKQKDLGLCFEVGKEAVEYATEEEFDALVADIVARPDVYAGIAVAGYQRTLREHTFAKRMEQMLSILFA